MHTAVHWATDYGRGIGNSFGFATHNERARQALEATGVRLDTSAPVAFHVTPPHRFAPIAGKTNIAYVAWEYRQLPGLFALKLADADAICVTAEFLREPFEGMFPGKPVHVVPLGVDFAKFPYADRNTPKTRPVNQPARRGGRPLRFLWLGAPNARKGPKHVLEAWKAFQPGGVLNVDDRVELYFKTTVDEAGAAYKGLRKVGNIIYDTRRLAIDDLAALYKSAHCFLFPSVGEGFGLTFAEALATGLPSIYTPETAMLDIAPPELGLGYPVRSKWVSQDWHCEDADGMGNAMTVHVWMPSAIPNDMVRLMLHVLNNYDEACQRGRQAAEYVRRFTWDECGRRLRSVVDGLKKRPAERNAIDAFEFEASGLG